MIGLVKRWRNGELSGRKKAFTLAILILGALAIILNVVILTTMMPKCSEMGGVWMSSHCVKKDALIF